MRNLNDHAEATTVEDSGDARDDGAGSGSRLADLHDEVGAQAAEYAMLGGVSAAACGGLITVFRGTDALQTVVSVVLDTVASFITSWF